MTPAESPAVELCRRAVRAIAIGGSAGSVEALRALLPALPAGLTLPVFVVVHVAGEAKIDWGAVFRGCKIAVREAEDKDPVEPGVVAVAPPGYHLLVGEDGVLSLSTDDLVHFARPSVDVLFESAAWAYEDRLLAIVLSGANADGALGLAAVRRAGGLGWVQAPEDAAVAVMPRAAAAAVPGARVLSIQQMADAFRALA